MWRRRLVDRARKVYREVVRGRTTVRVVVPETLALSCTPIFLIGPFRSGTTLVRLIVDSHSRICCPPESNFLTALAPLVRDRKHLAGLGAMGYDDEHVVRKLREFAVYFFENYARSHGKPRWADKTPAYTLHLDFLRRLFPEARFVLIYRHPLDTAHSMSKGGSSLPSYAREFGPEQADPRVKTAAYWRACVAEMNRFRAEHAGQCFSLQYDALCADPEGITRELFEFLDEPYESAVLEFHRFEHDAGFEAGKAIRSSGIQISENHYREWPAAVRKAATAAAEPEMSELGYVVEAGRLGSRPQSPRAASKID